MAPDVGLADTVAAAAGAQTEPLARLTEPTLPAPTGATPSLVGTTLGRYRLDRLLGEGGMGSVWAAHDPELGRTVAVKVLRAAVASADGEQRLRREAQTMARLAHPNVIRVYDVGLADGTLFVAMEYVADGTLKEWLAREVRSVDAIVEVFLQAGRGLAAAHDAGLVHRDVKPTNILVASDGRVLVSDFGVARPPSQASSEAVAAATVPFETLTHSGGIVGTPAYMAPEQHDGSAVDARADQFSFCVAMWQALYDSLPFPGRSLVEMAEAKAAGDITAPPSTAHVPSRVRAALERGLAPAAEARFETLHALLDALAQPASRRRRTHVALAFGFAGVAALGATAFVLSRGDAADDPCRVRDDRFAGVWDADRRRNVERTFRQAAVPPVVFTELARQLDARKAAWDASRLDACVASRVRKQQSDEMMDLRGACLDRRLGELRAFVDALDGLDAPALRTAAQSSTTIGLVDACNDVVTLARRSALPDEPHRRAAIAVVEQSLAAARSKLETGRFKEIAPDLVDTARAAAYAPVTAEALSIAAMAAARLDQSARAEQLMEEAVLAAEAGGDDAVRFDAEVFLVRLVGYQLERFADGEKHAERAKALLARLGADPRREAELSYSRAQAWWWAGKYAEAKQLVQEALDRFERLDPKAVRVALALHMRAITEQELRQLDVSVASEERARAIAVETLGPDHPTVGQMWSTSGGSLRLLGRHDEALVHLNRALAIAEVASGNDSTDVATILVNIATVSLSREKPEDAIAPLERAVTIFQAKYGPTHGRTAFGLVRLGSAYSRAGRADDALRVIEEGIAIYVKQKGPDSVATAEARTKLAEHYQRTGKFALARAQALDAIRAVEVSVGKTSSDLAKPLLQLGLAEDSLARRALARAALERGLGVVGDSDKTRRELVEALAKVSE